jgi:hypothetical protein
MFQFTANEAHDDLSFGLWYRLYGGSRPLVSAALPPATRFGRHHIEGTVVTLY